MKIIGLKANGFRKLSAVELKFNENGITVIMGDNEQGKTSVLDTIEYLFRGKTMVNDDIIQHGQEKMSAEIDLDEYTIKRIKTKKTDRLEIVNKEGFKLADKPQSFLDRLINDLTFDPFPFLNKTGDQKLKFMMDFLKLDILDLDEQIKQTEIDRLVCGREGKKLGEAVEIEKVEPLAIQILLNKKTQVDKENDDLVEKARRKRDKKIEEAHSFNKIQRRLLYDGETIANDIKRKESDIKVLYADLEQLKKDIAATEKEKIELTEKQKIIPEPKQEKNTDIPVDQPVLIDTESLSLDIQKAEETNIQAAKYQAYFEKKKTITAKRYEYDNLTTKIKSLRIDKIAKFRETDTGVQGLEIREDGLYFDDIYSENWSDAQGIKIACDLCIAMNPKLRAVFVDRGESFGYKRFAELETWAKVNNIQIIITRVVDSEPKSMPKNTFYILEGKIK
ncbi:AAA family ATPase [candidate division WOR-3 bacterium]|nr:AAA family ATPase [candidate division WOR-3 bacterium]